MIIRFAAGFDQTVLTALPIQPFSTMLYSAEEGFNADGSGYEDGKRIAEWRYNILTPEEDYTLLAFLGLVSAKSVAATVQTRTQIYFTHLRMNGYITRNNPESNPNGFIVGRKFTVVEA